MGFKVLILPVDTPCFTMKATLGESDYVLRFDYQERQDRWYLGVYTADMAPVALGMKVVCAWDVLRCCALSARPPGKLVFASDNEDAPPGFADLGRSCFLMYVDPAVA